ncbi:MAG: hypothetical protein Q8N51_18950, partial [Gammaproteobacteria bacterium]|nr:hypothetical protein [Gammaproteobacteria bacterium]
TVAFGRLLAQYRAESQALQAQVTADRAASQDRIAESRGQSLSGITTYADPNTGLLVQLPSTWDQYWVNDQGEYIAVNQPGFDPNTLNDGFWVPLSPHNG